MNNTPATNEQTPNSLLALAVESKLGVAELEKLVQLQERWEGRQAEKAFLKALSEFQEDCPEIRKTKNVAFNTTSYNYAPLASVIRQVKPFLKKHGLTYRWRIKMEAKIKVACLLSHIDGHTDDSAEMEADPDTSGGKNAIQGRGSAVEYMKRYTLEAALGISTTDDNDAQMAEIELNVDKLHASYMDLFNQIVQLDTSTETYSKMLPDNWKMERTGPVYVKAIGMARKKLFDLQQKAK